MPKHRCKREKCKDVEKLVFTFRQMERVVDLIDRQARLITGEKVLPADDYVYAKNEGKKTYFLYDSASDTYYFTLDARYPAIDNYILYEKDTYTDGVVGIYETNTGAHRERIHLNNNIYAKFNLNDAKPDESTITFYNIPVSFITYLYKEGKLERSSDNIFDFYNSHPVDYHRDYVAGDGPL